MMLLRTLFAVSALVLVGAIAWALAQDGRPIGDVLASMVQDPWTVVTLVDLYLGFFLAAVVVVLAEKRVAAGLLWAAPIFVLGNFWTAFWFVLRLPMLVRRLREQASDPALACHLAPGRL